MLFLFKYGIVCMVIRPSRSLCHDPDDRLIALAFTSWFLLFHHIQTTNALHKFILVYFHRGAIFNKIFPLPPHP